MIELRQYQRDAVDKCKPILASKRIVYLAAEVRVGKNIMSFAIAEESGWRRVCFITKKGAIQGVESDRDKFSPNIDLTITNFEQAHKLINDFDGFIIDEAHALGAFAKPSQRTKCLKELIGQSPVILMSGTPVPESSAQIFHQFWISVFSPFGKYSNFYKWSKDFVDVKKKFINGFQINDYSHGKTEQINMVTQAYTVTVSQEDAGFTSFVEEEILTVPINKQIYLLIDKLKKDKVYTLKSGRTIVCDTPVKMQSVMHQLSSGTIKINDEREVLDESKAWYIRSKFAGQKIAIYFQFVAEGEVLRKVFPNHTDDPNEFNNSTGKVFIRQFISGREGVNLSTADALIMYNISFSATTYWQVRARMQTMVRTIASKLYWIFSENGIENFVYKAVVKKQNYTKQYFVKDFKKWRPNQTYNPELSLT